MNSTDAEDAVRPLSEPELDADNAKRMHRIDRLARLLDSQFRLPGTQLRFGLDGLVGLIPGIGDGVTTLMSLYILMEAWQAGARGGTIARMLGNVGIDAIVGAIPIIGDIFDIGFKANRRNVDILRRHLAKGKRS